MADERSGEPTRDDGDGAIRVEGHTFERVDGAPHIVDPATGSTPGADTGTSGPKRRGRRPGSTNRANKQKAPLDVNGLETLLYSVHAMLATYLHVPEIELDKAEAERLSVAVARVLAHYPVNIAPQSVDIVNLVMALGMIYGSRIMAYRVRKTRATRPAEGEAPKIVNLRFVAPGMEGVP